MSEDKKVVIFAVNRVKEISFSLNESLAKPKEPIRIQFRHFTNFDPDRNLVDQTLRVIYAYDITKLDPDGVLVEIQVENVFTVPDLKNFVKEGVGYSLPKDILTSMTAMSISHARALLAKNIAGTVYQQTMLPILNPTEVAKSFYPNAFIELNENVPDEPSTIKKRRKKKI